MLKNFRVCGSYEDFPKAGRMKQCGTGAGPDTETYEEDGELKRQRIHIGKSVYGRGGVANCKGQSNPKCFSHFVLPTTHSQKCILYCNPNHTVMCTWVNKYVQITKTKDLRTRAIITV